MRSSAFDGTPLAALQFVNKVAAREARRYGFDAGDVANEMLARLHATDAGKALFLAAGAEDEPGIHARAHISRRMHGMVAELHRSEPRTTDDDVESAAGADTRSVESQAMSRAFWKAFAAIDLSGLPVAATAGGQRILAAARQDRIKAALVDNTQYTRRSRNENRWDLNINAACDSIGVRSDRRTREAMLTLAQQAMFAVRDEVASFWGAVAA